MGRSFLSSSFAAALGLLFLAVGHALKKVERRAGWLTWKNSCDPAEKKRARRSGFPA